MTSCVSSPKNKCTENQNWHNKQFSNLISVHESWKRVSGFIRRKFVRVLLTVSKNLPILLKSIILLSRVRRRDWQFVHILRQVVQTFFICRKTDLHRSSNTWRAEAMVCVGWGVNKNWFNRKGMNVNTTFWITHWCLHQQFFWKFSQIPITFMLICTLYLFQYVYGGTM